MNDKRKETGRTNQYTVAKIEDSAYAVSDETREKFRKSSIGRKHTEETTLKLSLARRKYLRENPDKHPWKRKEKFISVPCEKLKEYLTSKNIKFIEEWQPIEDRFFSIDIAFPDKKIGIEVNGNQHYNADKTLKDYYQRQHDLLEINGWKIFEIHYSSCFFPKFVVDNIKLVDLLKT